MATLLEITEKRKRWSSDLVRPEDFRWRVIARVDPSYILRNPAVTLYCLDERRRRAVFVETPAHVNVAEQAFYYQAQYAHAVRALTVSYEMLDALVDAAGEPFRRLIVIFSLGRCGSTLLSQAFRTVSGVCSISEPDVYTQLAAMRHHSGRADAKLIRLIHCATRLLCRHQPGHILALKPRSTVLDVADLVRRTYPTARMVFLYRDLASWARSMIRAFGVERCPVFTARVLARQRCVAAYLTRGSSNLRRVGEQISDDRVRHLTRRLQDIPAANALALMWLGLMERYHVLQIEGTPMLAMAYGTLMSEKESAVGRIFDYCGLSAAHVSAACQEFDRDAQRGTPLARVNLIHRNDSMVEHHVRVMLRVLSRYPFGAAGPGLR